MDTDTVMIGTDPSTAWPAHGIRERVDRGRRRRKLEKGKTRTTDG